MTSKSDTQNSSTSYDYGESIGVGSSWAGDCREDSYREDLAIRPTCIVVHSAADARLNGHLDAALRLMRNAALIFRDTAYDLEELVHTIEAARQEVSR
jgi:hypothetical protein